LTENAEAIAHRAKIVEKYLEERLKGKLRIYLEKISSNFEEERNYGCSWDTENNIRTNLGDR